MMINSTDATKACSHHIAPFGNVVARVVGTCAPRSLVYDIYMNIFCFKDVHFLYLE